ncbi:hypothetical protein EWM64_g7513 [Hericium alpestre]|uniref:DUF7918 domain-containing protein n=1 Tax=Hericium alpestre TaxID=135208 RepID=A0A4Y9ZSN6_9AGAM|nr:hypothetical protein EWM64_g7513 [Hericium alpestre]
MAGKEFEVHFKSDGYVGDISAQLDVDGRQAARKTRPSEILKNAYKFRGVRVNDGSLIRPFVFAAVQTVVSYNLSQLGTIEIKLYRAKISGFDARDCRRNYQSLSEIEPVPENAKVTGLSCTSLAAPKERKLPRGSYRRTKIDPEDKPYVLFQFRHLPRDVLQAQDILPADEQTPSANKKRKKRADPPVEDVGGDRKRKRTAGSGSQLPIPTQLKVEEGVGRDNNSSQTPTSCDPGQVQMLEQALKASQDALEKLQSQIQNLKSAQSGPSSPSKVERPSPIRLGPHNGEVIDLTED